MGNPLVILNDLKGRKIAHQLNLRYSATFGFILKAKQLGSIKKSEANLDKIRSADFRFNESLFQTIIDQTGE
jgi:predicted nucleic acid-binding protein